MNDVMEVILSILILIVITIPFFYFDYYNNKNKINSLYYYYNLVNSKYRECVIKNNCNADFIYAYNCSSGIKNIPENSISFYIIGNKENFCPTLVIINLDEVKN